MQNHNSQGWQQRPGYQGFHQGQSCNQNYSQNDGGGSGDMPRDSSAPPSSSSSFCPPPPQYGARNSMCPPPHQRHMYQPHIHPMHSSSRGMMTLSPHQMCMLHRDNPEAYMLIQQQRLDIYQHRVDLDHALKEVSRLRKELEEERSMVKRSDNGNKQQQEEGKTDVRNNHANPGEEGGFGDCDQDGENMPPETDFRKMGPDSPSSQLTDITHDSLPTKKRILEAAQCNNASIYNNDDIICNKSNNNTEEFHRVKKMKPSLTDLAHIGATLTSVATPHHNRGAHDGQNQSSRRSGLPDIATVAARLSAATSPKFHRVSSCLGRRNFVK